jgi:hypothetical protein
MAKAKERITLPMWHKFLRDYDMLVEQGGAAARKAAAAAAAAGGAAVGGAVGGAHGVSALAPGGVLQVNEHFGGGGQAPGALAESAAVFTKAGIASGK